MSGPARGPGRAAPARRSAAAPARSPIRSRGRGMPSAQARLEARASQLRRRFWHRVLWGLLAVAVAAGVVWTVWWSPVLAVRTVEVSGVTGGEASAVRGLVQVAAGTPLVRVDSAAVVARVRSQVTVAEVSVERSWPSTLVVHVVPRTPAIIIRNPQGQLEVVDRTGVSYATVSRAPAGVPLASASSSAAMTRAAVAAAISVVEALPADLSATVSALTVSSADLVTFRLGKTTVVWGGADDAGRKVAVLKALLRTSPTLVDVSAPDSPVTR